MNTSFNQGYITAKSLHDGGFTLEDLLELVEGEEAVSCGKWTEWLEGFNHFIITGI